MGKEREYQILTSNGYRISAYAKTLSEAYKKANIKLIAFKNNPKWRKEGVTDENTRLTSDYLTFHGKDFSPYNWVSNKTSKRMAEKLGKVV